MSLTLIGTKRGMTRVFTDTGESIPVTVVEIAPNRVSQIKTRENDGYRAFQITAGVKVASRLNKALAGHFGKAGVEAGNVIQEIRLAEDELAETEVGDQLAIDLFKEGQKVDVAAVSKGKGFAGVVKRHNFRTQDATHGNSLAHRAPGSIGQCQTPGRVFKGKKMAGQLGNKKCTVQHQEVVKIDTEKQVMLIKGSVPGAPGGTVMVKASVKARGDN
jgi:large subunit ribosomal protein L3